MGYGVYAKTWGLPEPELIHTFGSLQSAAACARVNRNQSPTDDRGLPVQYFVQKDAPTQLERLCMAMIAATFTCNSHP